MWCMKATWSLSANGISLSVSSCSRLLWKRSSRSSLGRQWVLWICSSVSTTEDKEVKKRHGNKQQSIISWRSHIQSFLWVLLTMYCCQMSFKSTVPVLNVRKKSSTCWHFGSSWMRSNWKGTMWMLPSETRASPAHTHKNSPISSQRHCLATKQLKHSQWQKNQQSGSDCNYLVTNSVIGL